MANDKDEGGAAAGQVLRTLTVSGASVPPDVRAAGGAVPASLTTGSAAPDWPVIDPQHYRITGEHARGGLGRILHAVDARLQRPIAMKQLLDPQPSSRARFAREALV